MYVILLFLEQLKREFAKFYVEDFMIDKKNEHDLVGWKESVCLTKFKLHHIRAKIDTGAKTSALHADDIEFIIVRGLKYVKFHYTDDEGHRHVLKSELIEERVIKSSNGEKTIRPVIKTDIKMGRKTFGIVVTLINRNMMGYKMLIGRDALKDGKFIINPAKQNLLKTPVRKNKKEKLA